MWFLYEKLHYLRIELSIFFSVIIMVTHASRWIILFNELNFWWVTTSGETVPNRLHKIFACGAFAQIKVSFRILSLYSFKEWYYFCTVERSIFKKFRSLRSRYIFFNFKWIKAEFPKGCNSHISGRLQQKIIFQWVYICFMKGWARAVRSLDLF